MSFSPSQTSHGLNWGRSRAPTVTGQRLTGWVIERNLEQEICVNIIWNLCSLLNVHALQFPVTEALRATVLKYFLTVKCLWNFEVLLTVHLGITLVNDQLDAQFFYFKIRLLQSSTCFEQRRAHHQEVKFNINTASGIVTLCKWPSVAPDGHLQRVKIPDAVLIKFDLLMMSTTLLETCRGL